MFNVVKLRSILDKLVYQDNYQIIDNNMSCSNIGARKHRNIRDHLFVVNAVLNDVIQSKKENVDIQIYDVSKCFDKMWYEETANDIYEAGVSGDSFVLMANSNQNCNVAVKTPWGSVTDRVSLKRIEMQGTNPAPLKCSVQVDTLGKDCLAEGEGLYKYKGCANIPAIDPPAAKKNSDGNLVTGKTELEKLYLETYVERLKPNQISEDLIELKDLKEYLFSVRKRLAEKETSVDWSLDELEKVLKGLKNDKARDAHGHIYEIYKHSGYDMRCSILRMFNMLKRKQEYPIIFQPSNISSFYKLKGDKKRFK